MYCETNCVLSPVFTDGHRLKYLEVYRKRGFKVIDLGWATFSCRNLLIFDFEDRVMWSLFCIVLRAAFFRHTSIVLLRYKYKGVNLFHVINLVSSLKFITVYAVYKIDCFDPIMGLYHDILEKVERSTGVITNTKIDQVVAFRNLKFCNDFKIDKELIDLPAIYDDEEWLLFIARFKYGLCSRKAEYTSMSSGFFHAVLATGGIPIIVKKGYELEFCLYWKFKFFFEGRLRNSEVENEKKYKEFRRIFNSSIFYVHL